MTSVPLLMRVWFFLCLPPGYLFTIVVGFLPAPVRRWGAATIDPKLPRATWTRAAWVAALDHLLGILVAGGIPPQVAAKALYDYYPAGHEVK